MVLCHGHGWQSAALLHCAADCGAIALADATTQGRVPALVDIAMMRAHWSLRELDCQSALLGPLCRFARHGIDGERRGEVAALNLEGRKVGCNVAELALTKRCYGTCRIGLACLFLFCCLPWAACPVRLANCTQLQPQSPCCTTGNCQPTTDTKPGRKFCSGSPHTRHLTPWARTGTACVADIWALQNSCTVAPCGWRAPPSPLGEALCGRRVRAVSESTAPSPTAQHDRPGRRTGPTMAGPRLVCLSCGFISCLSFRLHFEASPTRVWLAAFVANSSVAAVVVKEIPMICTGDMCNHMLTHCQGHRADAHYGMGWHRSHAPDP
jgi:hypothetical protein